MAYDDGGDFDDVVSGSAAPSYKWPEAPGGKGHVLKGVVVDKYRTIVKKDDPKSKGNKIPKLDKNDKEIPQLNITLQTSYRDYDMVPVDKMTGEKRVPKDEETGQPLEDTGLRRIYAKYRMRQAIGEAVKKVTPVGKNAVLEIGSVLEVKCIGYQDVGADNPLPLYVARVTPPAPVEDDGFGDSSSSPATTSKVAETDPWADEKPKSDEPPF
jgi:tartrate dehydratase beta subunit/fumarate hydratase class I family protein